MNQLDEVPFYRIGFFSSLRRCVSTSSRRCVVASSRRCVVASLRLCVFASSRRRVVASLRRCVVASLRRFVVASLRRCVVASSRRRVVASVLRCLIESFKTDFNKTSFKSWELKFDLENDGNDFSISPFSNPFFYGLYRSHLLTSRTQQRARTSP